MAEDPKVNETADSGEDAEKHFWDEHAKRTEAILDSWFTRKADEVRKTGTSRNGGRLTVPALLADFFFPAEKK